MRMPTYVAACMLLLITGWAHAQGFKAVVDDVVTAKVVAIKVQSGTVPSGTELVVRRDGKEVARLELKTMSGVCRVLSGMPKKGDVVSVAKAAAGTKPDDERKEAQADADARATYRYEGSNPGEKRLCQAEGALLFARYLSQTVAGIEPKKREGLRRDLDDRLKRVRIAMALAAGGDPRARVAAELRNSGNRPLAERVAPMASMKPLAPILPEAAADHAVYPYGTQPILNTDLSLWKTPSFWGEAPISPIFDGWRFDEKEGRIRPGTDALVRTDLSLDDVSISGEVNLKSGRSLFLILRGQGVIKFNHEFSKSGVSFKSGYDNLRKHTVVGSTPLLEVDRWYSFVATLRGSSLTVTLDDKTVLENAVAFKTEPKSGERYVGLGAYRAKGSFRNLRVTALSATGKRSLSVFVESAKPVPDGKAVDVLAEGAPFASLYGERVMSHRSVHHAVEKGVLKFSGSPFHQFTLKTLAADAFEVSGSMRVADEGNVWFRVNPKLLLGVAAKKRANHDADEPACFLKYKLGNYLNYDQGFSGVPITPGEWYQWRLRYVHPCLRLSINGDVVAMACMEGKNDPKAGFNHFGIGAFNVGAEFKNVVFQRLKPARSPAMDAELNAAVDAARASMGRAVVELKKAVAGGVAVAVLEGKRAPLMASSQDFIGVAEAFREEGDWVTYLSILEANYKRLAKGTAARTLAESVWRTAQQKFDLAQETMEPGDLGLDNVIKLDGEATAIAPSGRGGVWFHLKAGKTLNRLDPDQRKVVQTVPFKDTVVSVADRGDYLIVLCNNGQRFVKIDAKTGKELGRVDVSTGRVLDWVAVGGGKGYFSVDENTAGAVVFAKYAVYALDELKMVMRKTDAYGQYLAADPYGRYLYTGISVTLTRALRQFDPRPLRIAPLGAYVDHLLCFRIAESGLSLYSQRAAPGIEGVGLAASPRGRGVCYVAKKGVARARNQDVNGMKVPIYRAGRVDQAIASLDCGERPSAMAFNPVLREAYVYNGREILAFELKKYGRMRSIPLPSKSVTGAATEVTVDARGGWLYVAFSGKPGGVAVVKLSTSTGAVAAGTPEEALAKAKKLLAAGEAETVWAQLKALALDAPFTDVGEQAAALWLKQMDVDLSEQPVPRLTAKPLEDYLKATVPTPFQTPKLPKRPPYRPALSRKQQAVLDELSSFESLGKPYPASWVAMGMAALDESSDSPEVLLLLAERCLAEGKRRAAHGFAKRLLAVKKLKEYYAMRANTVLARAADELPDAIHGWLRAREFAPCNPFVHRRLGEAYAKAKADALANYHKRMSLHLFPSQPKLRAELEKSGLLKPRRLGKEKEIADLYKSLSPSTILIRHSMGVGTGFFITRDGLALTNDHVISGNQDSTVSVHLVDAGGKKHELRATVVATDARLDMAILSVNLGALTVEPMELAPSDLAKTGMRTIAIGNPGMGTAVLAQTVTEGIISNVSQRVDGQVYIQTSAAVNPGNSGGPLISRHGLVLGMVTLKASLDNVGFAIPAKRLTAFLRKHLD